MLRDEIPTSSERAAVIAATISGCMPCGAGTGAGAAAGAEPDDVILSRVHEVAKPRKVPVFCNTGCNHGNVREKLGNCDGVCMGTAFKKDGVFNGRVDKERVREFMEIVADIRKGL